MVGLDQLGNAQLPANSHATRRFIACHPLVCKDASSDQLHICLSTLGLYAGFGPGRAG